MDMILGIEYSAGVPKRMAVKGKGYSRVLSFPTVDERNQWVKDGSVFMNRDEIDYTAIRDNFPKKALDDLDTSSVHLRDE